MFNMASLSVLLLTLAVTPNTDSGQAVLVKATGDDAKACNEVISRPAAGSEDEDHLVAVSQEDIPEVWIGVRVSTVPEALAAHLKRGTLMIVNIAENSPAEHAGLDRYDVVLSFNGREINEMKDLLDAIRENGADHAAEVIVIQGGEQKTLTVTPIRRDLAVVPTFKYEEQEIAEVDPLSKYFGHRLKLGPGGKFLFTPQGRLDRLPDDIKRLLEEVPDLDRDVLDDLPAQFSINLDDDFPGFELFLDAKGMDESAHITIKVSEDGESITIERDEDGKFTVEREAADGTHTSESYDGLDPFREQDPEAYRIYRKSAPHRGFSTIVLPPDLKNLDQQQYQFQLEFENQIDKARQQAEEPRKQDRDARARAEVRRQKSSRGDANNTATHTKTVVLAVEDGHITLTITEDGVTREYKFDSREAFQSSEPELYERYKSHRDK
jgi:hypothetical protein